MQSVTFLNRSVAMAGNLYLRRFAIWQSSSRIPDGAVNEQAAGLCQIAC
jgi:hypothetical protein